MGKLTSIKCLGVGKNEVKISKEKKLKARGKTVGCLSVTHQWDCPKANELKVSGPLAC